MGLFNKAEPSRFRISNPLNVRANKNALTSAGFKVKQKQADTMRRLIQPWQARTFAYYDIVPELKYAASFYSRSLSVLRLYIGKIDENGDIEELERTEAPEATAQLERIQDPGGGRSGLLSAYGRLIFLTGEAYLFVSRDPETEIEQWEMLSTDELRVTGGGYTRFKAPSVQAEMFHVPKDEEYEPIDDDTAVAYRLWRRHPRWSLLADSSVQGVLDVLEELVLLTQAVRARARSRLAGSGILLVNGKAIPVPVEAVPDEDPSQDPFLDELTEAMTQPIVNEGAASAVVPLVVRVDVDDLDNVMKHLQLVDPVQLYPETGLRVEAVKRLAIGLDMPPEELTGLGDATHWTAWSIDENTWKHHLQPVAQQLVDDLTSSFLRPSLREMGVKNWDELVIGYDATAIINHPDRAKDAKDLYAENIIGKAAVRKAAGFDDEDAPTQEEWNESVGIKTRDSSLAVYGIPTIKVGGIEPEAGEIVSKDGTTGPVTSAETTKGPPPNEPDKSVQEPPGDLTGSLIEMRTARILGACDIALLRLRELAGSRLRNYAKRNDEVFALLDGTRGALVASTIGAERARELGAPPERELVAGAGELIGGALRMWGIDVKLADRLVTLIEQHAARTLWEAQPKPLPPQFEKYVRGLASENGKAA